MESRFIGLLLPGAGSATGRALRRAWASGCSRRLDLPLEGATLRPHEEWLALDDERRKPGGDGVEEEADKNPTENVIDLYLG